MASPLLVKTALWTKYLYFFVLCTFSVYFQAAHYLVLILMHTQEKIFLQTYEFLLESRCVITIVSKEIGYTIFFFFEYCVGIKFSVYSQAVQFLV